MKVTTFNLFVWAAMNDRDKTVDAAKPKGAGDPVQRAAREKRIKQNLRANLNKRKQKARALNQKDGD